MSISCSRRMGRTALRCAVAGTMALALSVTARAQSAAPAPAKAPEGPAKATYLRWCSGCHGDGGAGDGYAASFMIPRPRDLTLGNFYIRSTRSGDVPTDADLRRTIAEGFPGTAMSGWKTALSPATIDTLVQYVKKFSPFFAGPAPAVIATGPAPAPSAAGLEEGRRVYQQLHHPRLLYGHPVPRVRSRSGFSRLEPDRCTDDNVSRDHFDLMPLLDRPHRVDHVAAVAVRRIHHENIDSGIDQ